MPEITQERLDELEKAEAWLNCLEQAGLDNWDGCCHAYDIKVEQYPEYCD